MGEVGRGLFDANGTKLRKYYYQDQSLYNYLDYCGNFVYMDGHLDHILTTEGRIKVLADIGSKISDLHRLTRLHLDVEAVKDINLTARLNNLNYQLILFARFLRFR